MIAFLLLAACFLAYSNGANDNFKGVASLFGSRTCSYKTAISWATITTGGGSIAAIFLAQSLLKKFSADAAVVLEPTGLDLVIAHKGYAWFEIITQGRAAHGSLPAEGRDAIRMMGRVLAALDNLEETFAARPPHPLLGHGSLHASLISGGQELSSYPAECRLQLECRTLPGETVTQAEAALRKLLDALHAGHPEFRATLRMGGARPPYEISRESPIVRAAASAIAQVTGSVNLSGMAAWTDTALLAAAGIPGVVFGPSGRGLHGSEEYVELDSVTACAEVLRLLVLLACRP